MVSVLDSSTGIGIKCNKASRYHGAYDTTGKHNACNDVGALPPWVRINTSADPTVYQTINNSHANAHMHERTQCAHAHASAEQASADICGSNGERNGDGKGDGHSEGSEGSASDDDDEDCDGGGALPGDAQVQHRTWVVGWPARSMLQGHAALRRGVRACRAHRLLVTAVAPYVAARRCA